MKIFFCISMMFTSLLAIGQSDFVSMEEELAFYADVMINADEASHRQRAAESFQEQFEVTLNSPDSFKFPFDALKWISKVATEDGSMRIFSWIVEDADKVSKPYGYVQFASGNVQELVDYPEFTADTEYEITDGETWLGGVYYKLMPFVNGGKTDYLAFGYRQITEFDKVKILDVISVEGENITFGKNVFVKEEEGTRDDIKARLILTYSADATVSVNYNQGMGMIVYDHLISRMGRLEGQGPTQVPDGSYVAYKPDGDRWVYVDKLFHETSETAPRPKPVIGNGDKGIFGQSKTKKKKKRRN